MNQMTKTIFERAKKLSDTGRLRNEIYCKGRVIYLLNKDNTLLLRFFLPENEPQFAQEVSFNATEFISENFKEENGQAVFTIEKKDHTIKKTCCKASRGFEEIDNLFKKFFTHYSEDSIFFSNSISSSLKDELSHIELSFKNKTFYMIQRDIFSGGKHEIIQKNEGMRGLQPNLTKNFGPIGIRTDDFLSIFIYYNKVHFYFNESNQYFLLEGEMGLGPGTPPVKVVGIMACCFYDEIGDIEIISQEENDGRQEQEGRTNNEGLSQEINLREEPKEQPERKCGQPSKIIPKRKGFFKE